MKRILSLGILLLAIASSAWTAPIVIKTPMTEAEQEKVDAFIGGRDLRNIDNYISPYMDSIGPIEQILFRKAVLLGGLDATFVPLIVPNSARARETIRNGSTLGGGAAQWHIYFQELHNEVLESDVVIPQGSYEKGLYTTLKNQNRYVIKSQQDLQKLSAITSKTWEIDWNTLDSLKLAELYSAPTRPLQFKMIEGGRADFTLQDFSALPDLSIEEHGVRLFPIPGVKIALNGTRHYFINKNQPNSRVVFDALQKGLRILQQRGEIKRALVESGVLNPAVKDWILINP